MKGCQTDCRLKSLYGMFNCFPGSNIPRYPRTFQHCAHEPQTHNEVTFKRLHPFSNEFAQHVLYDALTDLYV